MNLYNEVDAYACAWLRNLVAAGHLPAGEVLEKSIADLHPDELAHAEQFHTFAGIGVWPYALALAGWPSGLSVWTGSCPCQPFSVAGRKRGLSDERHLWPAWFKHIGQRRPAVVLGEQVASPAGRAWFDVVSADLEGAGYAVAAANLCAAGIGAPHLRQRLFFVASRTSPDGLAIADFAGREQQRAARIHGDGASGHDAARRGEVGRAQPAGLADADEGRRRWGQDVAGDIGDGAHAGRPEGCGVAESRGQTREPQPGRLGDTDRNGARQHAGAVPGDEGQHEERGADGHHAPFAAGAARGPHPGRVGFPGHARLEGLAGHGDDGHQPRRLHALEAGPAAEAGPVGGFWRDAQWIPCRDGKWRPTVPSSSVLVDELAAAMDFGGADPAFPLIKKWPAKNRAPLLKAFGNAIVAELAVAFIVAVMQALGVRR